MQNPFGVSAAGREEFSARAQRSEGRRTRKSEIRNPKSETNSKWPQKGTKRHKKSKGKFNRRPRTISTIAVQRSAEKAKLRDYRTTGLQDDGTTGLQDCRRSCHPPRWSRGERERRSSICHASSMDEPDRKSTRLNSSHIPLSRL